MYIVKNTMSSHISWQFVRFLIVGILATVVHLGGFVAFIKLTSMSALTANIFAFTTAVLVSFFGHFVWTFGDQTRHLTIMKAHVPLMRFVATALLGAVLNSFIAWFIVDHQGMNYLLALPLMALVVPATTFVINRRWVFSVRKKNLEI